MCNVYFNDRIKNIVVDDTDSVSGTLFTTHCTRGSSSG